MPAGYHITHRFAQPFRCPICLQYFATTGAHTCRPLPSPPQHAAAASSAAAASLPPPPAQQHQPSLSRTFHSLSKYNRPLFMSIVTPVLVAYTQAKTSADIAQQTHFAESVS